MDIDSYEVNTPSFKRIAGAAVFGFASAGYLLNASERTIPAILSMTQKINLQSAQQNYDSMTLLHSLLFLVTGVAAAVIAGFVARRRGILAGLLANSVYMILFGYLSLVSSNYDGLSIPSSAAGEGWFRLSFQARNEIMLVMLLLAAMLGGHLGQKLYSREIDLDLNQDRLTVFGVRWAHYFWILPLILLGFLASIMIIVYATADTVVSDFSFAWHPSLWFNFSWLVIFPLAPFLVWVTIWITAVGFVRFFVVMQHRQTLTRGWKKLGLVLLYGVGAPALSYTVAAFSVDVVRHMPQPAKGDWKTTVGVTAIVVTLGLFSAARSWLKQRA